MCALFTGLRCEYAGAHSVRDAATANRKPGEARSGLEKGYDKRAFLLYNMVAHHLKAYLRIVIIVLLIGALQGQAATVTGPEGGAIEAGQDAVLTCIPDSRTSSVYFWNDWSGGSSVRIFTVGVPISSDTKYSNFASSPPGNTMTIIAATVDDEGQYECLTDAGSSPFYTLTVEVGSTLTMTFSTDPLLADSEFTAMCDVIGSRPQLDIAWTINNVALDLTPVVSNPTNADPDLSDTRSEVTLTATPAMNGQDLKCTTSGHVVTSLNRETTTQLNVEYPPTSETVTVVVDLTKERGTQLRVTCQVSAVVDGIDPANPDINMYTFYAGSEQIPSSTTENSVLVDIPENDTDYRCSASNDLGSIESEAVNYDPGPVFGAATVTGPAAVEQGQDATFSCTRDDPPSILFYSWFDDSVTPSQHLFNGLTPVYGNRDKYTNFGVSEEGATMTINNAAINDEGRYYCTITGENSQRHDFSVEVRSTLTMTLSTTDPVRADTEFTATCDVIGSRPQLDIAWTLNDNALDATPVVTNPTNPFTNLSDTTSAVTLTPTPEMNGQDLKCTTSGHVVTSLNREATTQLNVQYAPTDATATIYVVPTKEGDNKLRVTCEVSAVDGVQPANPAINNYTFYAGSEQIHSSTTDSSVVVDIPDNATDYKCSAGNDLGTIESEALNCRPGR